MIFLFLIFILLAIIITRTSSSYHTQNLRILWFSSFCFYSLYTIISHSYVGNPTTTYFINSDQISFYGVAIDLSKYSFTKIFSLCFTEYNYSGSPLAYALFGTLAKIGRILGETDILLFLKFHVTFLASLIPVYIYKIIINYNLTIPNLHNKLFLFALVAPIFSLSAQLMRDIHICLLFTIMTYVALCPKQSLRYFWLLLLMAVTYSFRVENGLFSAAIIAIPLYRTYRTGGYLRKVLVISIFCMFCIFALFSILEVASTTLTGYGERSDEMASASSLGNKLNLLPTPFAEFAKTGFSQLLPFPLWLPFTGGESYAYLRVIECFFPFYWIPIWMSLFYGWWKYRKYWNKDILAMFYISILYLVLNSAGEFNTRRLMAVYPMLLICFITLKQQFNLKKQKMNKMSVGLLIVLHIIYILITIVR